MAVQVMVEGQGPFSFLVDTGAERTVIARELAERLGLGRSEKLRLATIGVGTAIAPSFRVASLHMPDLSLTPLDAPHFPGRHICEAGRHGLDMPVRRRPLIHLMVEQKYHRPRRPPAPPPAHNAAHPTG